MTTTTPNRRRAHQLPVHPAIARHRRDVLRWALANAHPVERDALAVLVALRVDSTGGTVDTCWTTEQVELSLREAGPAWCRIRGLAVPPALDSTLSTYLRFLAERRLLGESADGSVALRRAIGPRSGSGSGRERHPASGRGRRSPVLPLS